MQWKAGTEAWTHHVVGALVAIELCTKVAGIGPDMLHQQCPSLADLALLHTRHQLLRPDKVRM